MNALESVKENYVQLIDLIVDNAYTGVIHNDNINDIISSWEFTFAHKRHLCMDEFSKGFESYGIVMMIDLISQI